MAPRLVVSIVRGGRAGQRWEFNQPRVLIGRRPGCDVAVDPNDRKASGEHVEITRESGRYFLKDLGSTNGTFIGQVRVEGRVPLSDGQVIELGHDGPQLLIRLVAAPAPDAPTRDEGASGRTAIYRAMMVETVRSSSRRLKLMILALSLVLVGGAVWAVLYIQQQDEETARLRREAREARLANERLADETTQLAGRLAGAEEALSSARQNLASTSAKLATLRVSIDEAEGDARQKLEAQARDLERTKARYELELRTHQKELAALKRTGTAAQEIARKYERSLFMLIAELPDREVGFCTAFTVSSIGKLATNAHCVRLIQEFNDKGHRILARMNRAPKTTYQVMRWRRHADYDNTAFSPDVAVIELELKGALLPSPTTVASPKKVRALVPGQPIYTMGFPGRVMNEERPAADFRAAVISRLTDYDNRPTSAENSFMVWHSALTSKGTSGSPIFDADGEVIAVNNGGLSARRVTSVDDKGLTTSTVAYDATGLNFGIRVDALQEVLIGR